MEKELFDPKFVHFDLDESHIGKNVFIADSIVALKKRVNGEWADIARQGPLKLSESENYPFSIEDGGDGACCVFYYYDPNYDVKRAYYKEGKTTIQFLSESDNKWFDVAGEPSWLDEVKYRVKSERETVDLGSYFKSRTWIKFNLNDYVKVKLNETGERLYLEHFTRTCISLSLMKKPDEDGYMTFQMHEFMNIFGSHFGPCLQDTPCCMDVLVEARE